MAVTIRFIAPSEVGIVALRIYEGAAVDGPFNLIERTTDIGTYPDYIGHYTTVLETSSVDWFAIAWEDESGAVSPMSEAVQGGTETLVGILTGRVALRMPDVDENVIRQESEAVIEDVLRKDPYGANDPTVKYKTWSGMTLMVMAKVQLSEIASANASSEGFTAGLVSMKSSSASLEIDDVKRLIDEASRLLGFTTARVVQMCVPEIAQGYSEIVMADISRLEIDAA